MLLSLILQKTRGLFGWLGCIILFGWLGWFVQFILQSGSITCCNWCMCLKRAPKGSTAGRAWDNRRLPPRDSRELFFRISSSRFVDPTLEWCRDVLAFSGLIRFSLCSSGRKAPENSSGILWNKSEWTHFAHDSAKTSRIQEYSEIYDFVPFLEL